MGAIIGKKKKKDKTKSNINKLNDQANQLRDDYHEDTNDAANLAIAICNKDESINVEMHFSCEQLPAMDLLGKTDAVIYVEEKVGDQWIPKGRTEVIPENLNPKFLKYFIFPYNVEKVQTFRLLAYDIDNFDDIEEYIDDNNRYKQDYIGSVEFVLREVMCSSNFQLQKPIFHEKKDNRGYITIRCNEYDAGGEKMLFHLGCSQFQSKNELFIRVSSQIDGRTYQPIYRTENLKNKKNLVLWNDFEIPLSKFGIDDKAYCKLEVVEFYKDKPEQILGEFENTLSYFKENTKKRQRIIINSLFKGEIIFQNIVSFKRVSFINYLLSNAQICLLTAIDFTNSNKPQTSQDSFHRNIDLNNPNDENQYSKALRQLNDIMEQFDHDNQIPLYGFGAKLPPFYNVVSNCFALNGNYFNPLINGSDGVVQTYKEKFMYLQFHGPTIFSEIIRLGAHYAKSESVSQKNQKYYVQLIVTDSDPNDLDTMIDELVEASAYPISYLIVGLGDNPFPKMQQELKGTGADYKIHSKRLNKSSERNNIHFFTFNEYCQDQLKLARECMRYLPQQFLQYMEKRGIIPIDTKRDLKTARTEYMRLKIDQHKKRDKQKAQNTAKILPEKWLTQMKDEFKEKLLLLGYDEENVNYLIEYENIPAPDLNLFIEMLSLRKEDIKLKKKLEMKDNYNNKNQLSTRVAIPQKVNKVALQNNLSSREKVGQRVFQVDANNQLDLIMKRKKKEISSVQQIFIQSIQIQHDPQKFYNQQIKVRRSHSNSSTSNFLFQKNAISNEKKQKEVEEINKELTSVSDSDYDSSDSELKRKRNKKKKQFAIKKQQNFEKMKLQNQQKDEKIQEEIEPVITIQNSVTKANELLVSQALQNDLNLYFQNTNYCLICNQNQVNTVFMPCGHAGYCQSCTQENLHEDICPICNKKFQMIILTQFVDESKE
ncbi:hypothetical protein ABPG72_013134 [Tetrahymena utriculariae]